MKTLLVLPTILPLIWTAVALAQQEFGFMPDGGKQMLARLGQEERVRVAELVSRRATQEEWIAYIGAADASLDAKAMETLASYLAVNMPMEVPARTFDGLPPDGKELAVENCQFCHSFFTGYLVQDRDLEGWRAIFKSPFHLELPMNPAERETFSRYSAINLPIPFEDVPEELRF